ncbi:hypothetical protein [Streptomyces sp. NRRL S-920]|uniref:hypothetical protein n=1 Tax=Streptomyces sp. NRRL S-920 TaxID=1463921 RepID=UPI000B183B83|nr:hypothetical protein [Streptomyces sp. NRRL S-920]
MMTAAHCVRRGSSPANTNFSMVFAPGHSKGRMPYGTISSFGYSATARSSARNSCNASAWRRRSTARRSSPAT